MLKAVKRWMFLAMSDIYRHTKTHTTLTQMFGMKICQKKVYCQPRTRFILSLCHCLFFCLPFCLTKELSLCHNGYHSMAIFHVIIWFSISSLKRLREAVRPKYTQGQRNIKQKERVVWLARSRYQHLVWLQWAWLFIRCESLHSLSHFLPLL